MWFILLIIYLVKYELILSEITNKFIFLLLRGEMMCLAPFALIGSICLYYVLGHIVQAREGWCLSYLVSLNTKTRTSLLYCMYQNNILMYTKPHRLNSLNVFCINWCNLYWSGFWVKSLKKSFINLDNIVVVANWFTELQVYYINLGGWLSSTASCIKCIIY